MSHREKSSASCDRDSDKYCTENCDSDTDEEKLKREMDRIRKELGELSKEEAKKYDSCRKDRGTKKEFAEKRTRTSRERYRSPESPRSSKSSNMKVKSRRDSLLDVSSERSTSAEKRRERKERSAKRERDYAEKKKSSRSKSPYRNRNWRRSQSRDKMSSPGRRKRDSSGSRKDRCKKRNWKELSNGSDDRWRSGSKDASSRRTQKEKDKKKMKLMEAKEEEMSTKNFMRGLLDQIQNNQLVTDKVPVSDDKVNCTEVEKEDVKTSDESKEGVTKQLDLEAYKSRILGGMAGGDEDTSESPTKSESVPRDSESLQPSYNAVQSLSICQSFPKFSTFESNPSEGSKHVNQNITDGSTSSNVAVASDASSVKSTENAQLLQSNPTRMRAPTYRPRYTPETQLISKALRFYAPQLGGVRPNLDPRPAASSNISNPPPFARSRQPAAVPTARLQVNQQSQNVPANMRPHAAMLGQRNNYPMPMIRNIHSMQRTSAAMGMSFAPRPMGHRNANMGMTPARPIAAHGRCYAPFNPARGSAPFRTAANPIRHLMPPSNYSSPMNPNSSEHHSPAQSFIDDDTGPMNSFSEPRRLNLQTF